MNAIQVFPSTLKGGSVMVPPSKSHTLRALLFASMAHGTSTIRNYLHSPDTIAMIQACRQLGAHIIQQDTVLEIQGVGGQPHLPDDVIDAGNSGQLLRFIGAVVSLLDGYVVLTGDASLRHHRSILPLIEGLQQLGAQCMTTQGNGYAPWIIKGPISPGVTTVHGQDSQMVSALLIVSAFLKGTTYIDVREPGEIPWVQLTLDWLKRLGVIYDVNATYTHYVIKGGEPIAGFDYIVPRDFSSLAFPLVAALITQSALMIPDLDMTDVQGDKRIIDVLCHMGAQITYHHQVLYLEPSYDLNGADIDVNDMIDALPILAVVGCYAKGTTHLFNAKVADQKESHRLQVMSKELRKMGAIIKASNDALTIQHTLLHGAHLDSHDDHRVAMALTVAALGAKTPSIIHHVACTAKSYPGFIPTFQRLGALIQPL